MFVCGIITWTMLLMWFGVCRLCDQLFNWMCGRCGDRRKGEKGAQIVVTVGRLNSCLDGLIGGNWMQSFAVNVRSTVMCSRQDTCSPVLLLLIYSTDWLNRLRIHFICSLKENEFEGGFAWKSTKLRLNMKSKSGSTVILLLVAIYDSVRDTAIRLGRVQCLSNWHNSHRGLLFDSVVQTLISALGMVKWTGKRPTEKWSSQVKALALRHEPDWPRARPMQTTTTMSFSHWLPFADVLFLFHLLSNSLFFFRMWWLVPSADIALHYSCACFRTIVRLALLSTLSTAGALAPWQ